MFMFNRSMFDNYKKFAIYIFANLCFGVSLITPAFSVIHKNVQGTEIILYHWGRYDHLKDHLALGKYTDASWAKYFTPQKLAMHIKGGGLYVADTPDSSVAYAGRDKVGSAKGPSLLELHVPITTKLAPVTPDSDWYVITDYHGIRITEFTGEGLTSKEISEAIENISQRSSAYEYFRPRAEKILQDRGYSDNQKNQKNNLLQELLNNHPDVAVQLITATTDLNTTDIQGNTPLMIAAQRGYKDVATKLIQFRADSDLKNKSGFTAFDIAKSTGNGQIEKLINGYRLMTTIAKKDTVSAMRILNSGVQIDFEYIDVNNANKETLFIMAAKNGLEDVARELIKRGSNINAVDLAGHSGLYNSILGGHLNIAQAILNSRSVNTELAECASGYTPLILASSKGMYDIAKELLLHGANSQAKSISNKTAFDIATDSNAQGQYEIGMLFYYGQNGIPRDYAQAKAWLSKAATNKHAKAILTLRNMHQF